MFSWLLDTTVVAALLAALVIVTGRLSRSAPAVRHALWLIVLIKFLLPPLFPAPYSPIQLTENPSPFPPAEERVNPVAAHSDVDSLTRPIASAATIPEEQRSLDVPGTHVRASSAIAPSGDWPSSDWFLALWSSAAAWGLMVVWLASGCIVAGRQIVRIARLRRLARDARHVPGWLEGEVAALAAKLQIRPPSLVVAEGIRTPFVWCWGRPRLFWPADLAQPPEPRRWHGVIAHELAHLKRRDHLVAWLELAAGWLWWWNPVFWYVRSQLRESAEQACDAWAVSVLPHARRAYAETIVEVTELVSQTALPAPALGASSGARRTFQRRLTMILCERVPCKLSWRGLIAAAMLALVALPSWLVAQAPTKKDKPAAGDAAQGAKPDQLEVYGQVKAIDAAGNTITLGGKGFEKTFSVAPDARVILDDGTGDRFGFQPGKLADVAEGLPVTLRLSTDQKVVGVWIEGPSLKAVLKSVDAANHLLTVAVSVAKGEPLQDKTFEVAKNAKLVIAADKGKDKTAAPPPAKQLTDLPAGAALLLKLSADQKVVGRIQVDQPSVHGTLKSVDATKHQVILRLKSGKDEAGEEHTYDLAKDVKVTIDGQVAKLSDLPTEAPATIKLSFDQKEVLGIQVEGSQVFGVVKVVDASSRSVTIAEKMGEKTFEVAKDASILVDDKPQKLDDVPAEAFVTAKLSADQKIVRSLQAAGRTVHGTVRAIDDVNKEITVEIPKEGEATFKFADDLRVLKGDKQTTAGISDLKPDREVALFFSADQKAIRRIVVLEE
jgi:beta-lactamase regulating signal transducer with metallopeptidase domain